MQSDLAKSNPAVEEIHRRRRKMYFPPYELTVMVHSTAIIIPSTTAKDTIIVIILIRNHGCTPRHTTHLLSTRQIMLIPCTHRLTTNIQRICPTNRHIPGAKPILSTRRTTLRHLQTKCTLTSSPPLRFHMVPFPRPHSKAGTKSTHHTIGGLYPGRFFHSPLKMNDSAIDVPVLQLRLSRKIA